VLSTINDTFYKEFSRKDD